MEMEGTSHAALRLQLLLCLLYSTVFFLVACGRQSGERQRVPVRVLT
jgi:hypothetical protein